MSSQLNILKLLLKLSYRHLFVHFFKRVHDRGENQIQKEESAEDHNYQEKEWALVAEAWVLQL